jgi:flagellar hook-associated protein 1 FlgK
MSISALDIALTGLNASQSGMDAVSQNLANASTTGYIAQTAEMGTLAGGPGPVGSGVEVDNIQLDNNPALTLLAQATSAQAGAASALAQALQDAQSVFTDFPASSASSASSSSATSASGAGLQAQLSAFWSNWAAVANSPGSLAARTSLLGSAQTVVDTLHSMASGLSTAAQGTQDQLSELVAQVNEQLGQLASLNEAVLRTAGTSGGGANALVEQQVSLANKLASEVGATNSANAQGSMSLSVGGVLLVSGGSAATVSISGTGTTTALGASGGPLGATTALPVGSGQAAGLLQAVTSELPSWQSSLDNVASTLASAVNTQLEAGVYWVPLGSSSATSSPGIAMFQSSTGGAVTAADIELSPAVTANPATIAAGGSSASGPLDGSNAQAVSDLASSTSGAGSLYQALVGQAGSAVQSAEAAQSATSQAASSAEAQASASEGVNSNAQLTALLQYQQMYEASGKVISAAASMFASLLAEVS